MNKLAPLEAIDTLVKDGDTVSFGGAWLCNHPMAAVRQLVRAERKGLRAVAMVGSIDIDLLVAAGCLDRLLFSMVSLEAFGLAQNVRRAIETGALDYSESTGLALVMALDAAGRGLPSINYRGPFGSDIVARHPEIFQLVKCPFTGLDLVAVRALVPDVAIVHASRCDADGNAQWEGTSSWDIAMAKAARRVIVTCEEVIDRSETVRTAAATRLPGYFVDTVIHTPFGAHPCSHAPRYSMDAWDLLSYSDMQPQDEAMGAWVAQLRREDEAAYQRRVMQGDRREVLRALSELGDSRVGAA